MLLVGVEQMCREQAGTSHYIRALESWAAWTRELIWSGDWAGFEVALRYLAAIYGELVVGDR
jgi:hypothetical protein